MGAGTSLDGQLEERYFLQKVKLGQGSFGSVHRAVDRQKNRTVAIKQLEKASLPRRHVSRADIEREIKMMQACRHENITELYDTFEDDASIYLALEYCDGGDFGDKVKERGMGVAEPEVAEWMRQMCAAILAMHSKGICHRDVKPDNFMVQDLAKLKLADFGLAIYVPKGKLLQEKCGTPAFMAPEQHQLPKFSPGYGFPADMWAVGVSMYMLMFGGRHPFLTDKGGLDENLLRSGELDFRDKSGANLGFLNGLLGGTPLRFSEEARFVCNRMVEADPSRRLTAEDSARIGWLEGARTTAGTSAEASAAGTPRSTPSGRSRGPSCNFGMERSTTEKPPSPRHVSPQRPASSPVAVAGAAVAAFGGAAAEARASAQDSHNLAMANQALITELEERKRREEELLSEHNRMALRQKILERRRTKELDDQKKLNLQKEQELQAMQEERRELERLRAQQASRSSAPPHVPSAGATAAGMSTAMKATSGLRGTLLQPGMKCLYESATYGWVDAVINSYNTAESTYTLDVKQHVPTDKIAPPTGGTTAEAWPAGSLCCYLSSSADRWLPAVVASFNESEGTYNLDLRPHADPERMRARPEPAQDKDQETRPMQSRLTKQKTMISDDSTGGRKATYRLSDLETTAAVATRAGSSEVVPPRWVNRGDYCLVGDHGLVLIDTSVGRDGRYNATVQRTRASISASVEDMRAPKEERYAWPPGTQVAYHSATAGKWIDASVLSFSAAAGAYNLDVRQDAAPDKIRPR